MNTVSISIIACLAGIAAGWFLIPIKEKNSPRLQQTGDGLTAHDTDRSNPQSATLDSLFDPNASEYEQLLALALTDGNAFSSRNRELAAQMSEVESISDRALQMEVRDALFREWIAKDPTAAFTLLRKRPQHWIGAYFSAWVKTDREAAIKALEGLPVSDPLRSQGASSIVYTLVKDDPDAAFDVIQRLEIHDRIAFGPVFAGLAKRNLKQAIAKFEALAGPRNERDMAFSGILTEWVVTDVDAAIVYAKNVDENWSGHVMATIEAYAKNHPQRALQLAEQHLTGGHRKAALTTAVNEWAKEDPAAALDYTAAIANKGERNQVMSDLVTQLAASQHFDVALRALTENEGIARQVDSVFAKWAAQDWDAAAIAALNFPSPEGRLEAIQGVMRELPQKFVREGSIDQWAASLIEVAAADAEGNGSLYVTPSVLGQLQPETLKSLIANHGSLLQNALPYVVPDIAAKDPAFALELVEMITDPEVQNRIALDLAIRNIETDPAAAAEESALLTEGKVRNTAFRNVANTWTRSDPLAARNWIASLEPSPARDVAAAEYIDVIAGRDPENALAVARQMSDAGQREEAVGDVLAAWVAADVDRASEAMAGMQIPESVSDRVNKAVEEARAWQKLSR
ncbi:MAG: hypothetical protein KDN22_13640 [Verrucomicrobiae bacterium]|nr:hypothetical protein [Verrucomicrobiae bacterium]